jgi:hypothetical protein
MGGRSVLVVSSSRVLPPAPGDSSNLLGIFQRMLGDEQCGRFLLWLHVARKRLSLRLWHPLPALCLVGPRDCGKSLAQQVVTDLLGGRAAKPGQYMQGQTPFNADLFGAEHLVFEDESARTDGVSRRTFGESLKTLLFCRLVQAHGKHRQPIALEPVWALSMSVNDNPEHLLTLPPIDDSLADKILLLRCEHHPRPVPEGVEESEWLRAVMRDETPALAAIVDDYGPDQAPGEFQSARTVIAGWQNREVLSLMRQLSDESRLLEIIDDSVFADGVAPWVGTAEQLSRDLRCGKFGREAERLLRWPQACGTYLARLAKQRSDRVEPIRTNNARRWRILPPTES